MIRKCKADKKASDFVEEFLKILDRRIQREVVLINVAGGWMVWSCSIFYFILWAGN
jgi:hypothetical protein